MASTNTPFAPASAVEVICRNFIELRYQLLPYLYCLFAEAHRTGAPIMRPLFWHHQDDPVAVATSDEFLLGENLLVAPILRQGAVARSVYLPRGTWFDFWTDQRHTGGAHIIAHAPLEIIPLFVRAGAIIPMTEVQQFVGEKKSEKIFLHIWPGAGGELNWHEDDGETMTYESGNFHSRQINFSPDSKGGGLRFGKIEGAFRSRVKTWRVILHRVNAAGKQLNPRICGIPNSPKLETVSISAVRKV
jgi:alpha-glucosidase